eukprot:351251-Chlamydomonas_euryale.AAC.4
MALRGGARGAERRRHACVHANVPQHWHGQQQGRAPLCSRFGGVGCVYAFAFERKAPSPKCSICIVRAASVYLRIQQWYIRISVSS